MVKQMIVIMAIKQLSALHAINIIYSVIDRVM